MRLLLAAAFCFCSSTTGSASSFYDGNSLHEMCVKHNGSAHMYIIGVLDGTDSYTQAGEAKSPVCLPRGVIAGQVSEIACNYLRDHPEKRQYSAAGSVVIALMKVFPCK